MLYAVIRPTRRLKPAKVKEASAFALAPLHKHQFGLAKDQWSAPNVTPLERASAGAATVIDVPTAALAHPALAR